MRLFNFILLFFLMIQPIYMFQYFEIFQYDKPVLALLKEENFIKHFSKEKNFQMKEVNNTIEITYDSKQFGYFYTSYYKIEKYKNSFKIFYRNQYLENKIIVEEYTPKEVYVKTDTKTLIPIPNHILRRIIRSRVRSLFSS